MLFESPPREEQRDEERRAALCPMERSRRRHVLELELGSIVREAEAT